jgi:hypothetical protein
MRSGNRNLLVALGALAALSFTAKANAQSETFTTTIPYTTTDFAALLQLPKFNMPGETLVSEVFSFSVNTLISGTVKNTSLTPVTATFTEDVTGFVTVPPVTLSADGNMVNESIPLAVGQTATIGPITTNGTVTTATYTPSSPEFSDFVGAGTTNFPVTTSTDQTLSSQGGNVQFNLTTQAEIVGTVTYNYAPIPEASTLLGFTALLGMGVIRLRRRSKVA